MKKSKWPLKRAKLTLNGESVKWENKWNKSAENINFPLALLSLARFYLTQLISDKYKKIIKEGKGIQLSSVCIYCVRIFFIISLGFSSISFFLIRKRNEEKLKMIFLFIVLQAFIGEWWYFTLVYTTLSLLHFIFDQNENEIKNEEIFLLFLFPPPMYNDSYNGNDGATAVAEMIWSWFKI